MSGISREEIEQIARLAALDLEPAAIAPLTAQIHRILEYVSQLESAVGDDTPFDWPHTEPISRLRPDDVRDADLKRPVGSNAPLYRDGLFVVPRVRAMERE